MAPPLSTSRHRLLVEGRDDKYAIINLLARHGYKWDDDAVARPFVADTDGITRLLAALPVALKTHDRLGVVVDADLDLTNRWGQIRNTLRQAGLAAPDQPDVSGTIIDGPPRVGVWLMPDNVVPGMLEDFLCSLVPDGDPCWPHADQATAQARKLGAPLRQADHVKGRVHAWLAWQEDPGLPFGTALSANVLGCESPAAGLFVSWFHRLFGQPAAPALRLEDIEVVPR